MDDEPQKTPVSVTITGFQAELLHRMAEISGRTPQECALQLVEDGHKERQVLYKAMYPETGGAREAYEARISDLAKRLYGMLRELMALPRAEASRVVAELQMAEGYALDEIPELRPMNEEQREEWWERQLSFMSDVYDSQPDGFFDFDKHEPTDEHPETVRMRPDGDLDVRVRVSPQQWQALNYEGPRHPKKRAKDAYAVAMATGIDAIYGPTPPPALVTDNPEMRAHITGQ